MSFGNTAVPLRDGLASIVTYTDGSTDIGSWHQEVPAPGPEGCDNVDEGCGQIPSCFSRWSFQFPPNMQLATHASDCGNLAARIEQLTRLESLTYY